MPKKTRKLGIDRAVGESVRGAFRARGPENETIYEWTDRLIIQPPSRSKTPAVRENASCMEERGLREVFGQAYDDYRPASWALIRFVF